jgi:hypothetical protein
MIANRYQRMHASTVDASQRRAPQAKKHNTSARPCALCDRPAGEHFGLKKKENRWCPKPGGGFLNTKYTPVPADKQADSQ